MVTEIDPPFRFWQLGKSGIPLSVCLSVKLRCLVLVCCLFLSCLVRFCSGLFWFTPCGDIHYLARFSAFVAGLPLSHKRPTQVFDRCCDSRRPASEKGVEAAGWLGENGRQKKRRTTPARNKRDPLPRGLNPGTFHPFAALVLQFPLAEFSPFTISTLDPSASLGSLPTLSWHNPLISALSFSLCPFTTPLQSFGSLVVVLLVLLVGSIEFHFIFRELVLSFLSLNRSRYHHRHLPVRLTCPCLPYHWLFATFLRCRSPRLGHLRLQHLLAPFPGIGIEAFSILPQIHTVFVRALPLSPARCFAGRF